MKILILNGPNMNRLGKREPGIYGSVTLAEVEDELRKLATELNVEVVFAQSNAEHTLIETIQLAPEQQVHGIVINAGGYTHTSVAIRDALLISGLPFAEIHVSNLFARESFRQKSLLSDIASGVVVGFGTQGYGLALRGLVSRIAAL